VKVLFKTKIFLVILITTISTIAQSVPKKSILCSFYPIYIMTLNIGKDIPGITIENLTTQQTGCLHDYQLTPRDMKKLSAASILVINGGGLESFIKKAVQQQPGLKIIEAGRGIEMTDIGIDKHNHEHDSAEEKNPHIWVSISGAIAEVKNIRDGLVTLNPENATAYTKNAGVYISKLEALRIKMHEGLADITSRDIITFHEAFPWFAKEFNLIIAGVIEREPGSQPSAGELTGAIKTIRQKKVKAIFAEPQYSATAAQTIARETGAKLYTLDPAVTGPDDPDAYIKAMESNLAVLKEALR
jgi:zinc transport system substrate-binding protein